MFFNRSGMTVPHTAEIIMEILHGISFPGPTEGLWCRAGVRELAASA